MGQVEIDYRLSASSEKRSIGYVRIGGENNCFSLKEKHFCGLWTPISVSAFDRPSRTKMQ